jgi:ABC-2 type transport system ATP-binding protein
LAEGSSAVAIQKLNGIPAVERCVLIENSPVTIRAYSKSNGQPGELARAIGEMAAAEGWTIEELHTEEGRLDEVFRHITLPDTTQAHVE